jgi:hypothetical protein
MNREPIYAALFDLIKVACGPDTFVTTSRLLKHWADVPATQRPALFQTQKNETAQKSNPGLPTVWHLEATLYIYVSTRGATSPGEVLNPILDAIDAAMDFSSPGNPQTLGGLVQWARIEGTIETYEGTLGNDECALVPIKMLAA